jgi:hypothetical protein
MFMYVTDVQKCRGKLFFKIKMLGSTKAMSKLLAVAESAKFFSGEK